MTTLPISSFLPSVPKTRGALVLLVLLSLALPVARGQQGDSRPSDTGDGTDTQESGNDASSTAPSPAPQAAGDADQAKDVPLFDGKTLTGWRIIEKFDFQDHGQITVKDGVIRLEKGKPATGISWKGEIPRSNYRLTFMGRRMEGSDFFCGLTFPVKQEFCTLILGGWGGQVVGLSNIDGFSAVENNTTQAVQFETDRWYAVELTVTDERILVKLDQQEIIDEDTAGHKFSIWWEQEPVTPLGIVSWYTTSEIKDLKLVKLP